MNDQNQAVDHYGAVLADLRAQRDKIDQAIAVISSLRGLPQHEVSPQSVTAPTGEALEDAGSMFLGMSIPDAVIKLLSVRKKKMGNAEIYAGLKAGGLELTSQEPLNVIGSVLSRRFHDKGDIVRVERGIWGLKSWYPGRNFKKVSTDKEDRPVSGPDTFVYPSEGFIDAPEENPAVD